MERVGWLVFVERADSLNQPIQTQTDLLPISSNRKMSAVVKQAGIHLQD